MKIIIQEKNTIYVGYPSEASLSFETIGEALFYLRNLPLSERPNKDNAWNINIAPGTYAESGLFLKHCHLRGAGIGVTKIIGVGNGTNHHTLWIEDSEVSNLSFDPSGYSVTVACQVILGCDCAVTTPSNEREFGPVYEEQNLLIYRGNNEIEVVFGEEDDGVILTTEELADRINEVSLAFGVVAIAKFGRVLILDVSGASETMKILKEGTANEAFGYPTDEDLISTRVVSDGCSYQTPIIHEFNIRGDIGVGSDLNMWTGSYWCSISACTITGGKKGIHVESGNLTIQNTYLQNQTERGVIVGSPLGDGITLVEAENCEFWGNSGWDIEFLQPSAYMKCKNTNYQHVKYANDERRGVIQPTGTRIMLEWHIQGTLSVGTYVGGVKPIPYDFSTIERVVILREIAGTDGDTIIDVNAPDENNNPVSLYTTQANRPRIAASDGNRKVVIAALPDILKINAPFPNPSWIAIDIDAVESGSPEGLTVQIYLIVVGEV